MTDIDHIDIAIHNKNALVFGLYKSLSALAVLVDAEGSVLNGSDQLLLATLETHPASGVKRGCYEG